MRKANNSWRKYKTKLRKNYFKGDDVDKWIENIPEHGVRPEAWRAFCLNEATPEQLAVRDRNKKNKNNCPRKSTHNTGRYGYARAEEKFKEENNGRTPMRVELWLYTHKRKDGSYAPHDEELAVIPFPTTLLLYINHAKNSDCLVSCLCRGNLNRSWR